MHRRAPSAPRARAAAALVAAAALALSGAGAVAGADGATPSQSAAPPGIAVSQGFFGILPAKRLAAGTPPVGLAPTTVRNTTRSPYAVKVFPVMLTQLRSGSFTFDSSAAALARARRILHVNVSRFALPAYSTHDVSIVWRALPHGQRAAYVGLLVQGTPPRSGVQVRVISRLLGLELLHLPGRYVQRGRLTGILPQQGTGKTLRFLLSVRNTGDLVGDPSAVALAIRNAAGRVVARGTASPALVLPGVTRDFVVQVDRVLPAGSYRVSASAVWGGSSHRVVTMRLVGPNKLPTPATRISPLRIAGTVGGAARLRATVASTGTAPASLRLRIELLRLGGAGASATRPVATAAASFAALAPGTSRALDQAIGSDLANQPYRVVVSYTDSSGAPQQLTTDFRPVERLAFATRAWHFVKHHAVPIVAAIAVILLALITLVLLRRQRRLQRELARVRDGSGVGAP